MGTGVGHIEKKDVFMKLSTKGRYGVMAMMELALSDGRQPINLTDISKAQGISLSYLEQLFTGLRKKGLVKGRRGPGGGYRLAKPADMITVADIINAVSEPNNNNKDLANNYAPAHLWEHLSIKIEGYLKGISLRECIDSAKLDVQAMRLAGPQSTVRPGNTTRRTL